MTRFAQWPPWAARLLLLLCAALAVGVAAVPHKVLKPPPPPSQRALFRDGDLYEAVVVRVSAGQDYYSAAAIEHRLHKYPTSPPVVFRQPWLAWALASLHFPLLRYVIIFPLFGVLSFLFYRELLTTGLPPLGRVAAFMVFLSGVGMVGIGGASYLHEVWAAFLISISLAIYRADRWAWSVCLGLIACLIRELAFPYVCVMAAFALSERRWRELAGWVAAGAAFCVAFGVHLSLASTLYRPGDLESAGWLQFGGPPFVVVASRWNLLLFYLPDPLVALAIALSLIGLAGWRDPRTARAALIVGGYVAAFNVVGRPDTSNWGQLYTPLVAVGLVLAPAALSDLARSALRRRQSGARSLGNA